MSEAPVIGIDLGTTNSLVAYRDERGPQIIRDAEGKGVVPSVVAFDLQTGRTTVGEPARRHAVEHPGTTVFSIKRLMGKGLDDLQSELRFLPYRVVGGQRDMVKVAIGEKEYTPQELSAIVLRELKQRAEEHFGRAVEKAVITVPAYFDDAQRQATRDAGRIAGLEVLRIVNEPTAAALAYGLGRREGCVAVYDFGGGTFDISILQIREGVFHVLSTAGDTHLGGDDLDRELINLIQEEIREQFGRKLDFPPATRQAFRNFAEAAKIRLSEEASATIEIELGRDRPYRRTITREEFEGLIGGWVERTVACCRRALRDAGKTAADIEQVVMVGGSTRIPLVRRRVGEVFDREPYTALNPEEVVALGAAVQASILAGATRDILLLDVIPLSLGIETMGGAFSKLILKNTTIPTQAGERFTTFADGQTSVKINVLQGERELAADCRSLGQFELKGIPPMPAGIPKLLVTFLVDANGILHVSAREERSGQEASVQILPHHGLTEAEVERMTLESYEHAREDMTAHRLIDLRTQVQFDLQATRKSLQRVGDQLDAEERQRIESGMAKLQELATGDDPEAIWEGLDRFNKMTRRLAELAVRDVLVEDGS